MSITRVWIDPHQRYSKEYRTALLTLPELYTVELSREAADIAATDLLAANSLSVLVARYFAKDVELASADLARSTIEITITEPGELAAGVRRQTILQVLSALGVERLGTETWTERPESLLLAASSGESILTFSHGSSLDEHMNIQISDADKRVILDASITGAAIGQKVSIQDRFGTRTLRPKFESVIRRWLLENEKTRLS